jgi:hypothetical protein
MMITAIQDVEEAERMVRPGRSVEKASEGPPKSGRHEEERYRNHGNQGRKERLPPPYYN